MKKLIFATHNSNKVKEVRSLLKGSYEILGLNDIGFAREIIEDKQTIIENSIAKVKFIKENTLLGQSLITDPKNTVSNYLNEISKSSNLDLNIASMDLYTI